MRICSVDTCDRKHYALGYCQRHYNQICAYGEIVTTISRTRFDRNEINTKDLVSYMDLYNKKCEKISETIFDSEFEIFIKDYKWHLDAHGYVMCDYRDENNQKQKMSLHAAILYLSGQEVKDDEEIDHHNNNPLNNLKNNLRICKHLENQHNTKIRSDNTSGYKGVSWSSKHQQWRASITVNNKQKHLGYFDIKEDAARAYNTAAIKYFGEFAKLNIIQGEDNV